MTIDDLRNAANAADDEKCESFARAALQVFEDFCGITELAAQPSSGIFPLHTARRLTLRDRLNTALDHGNFKRAAILGAELIAPLRQLAGVSLGPPLEPDEQ